MKHGFVKVAAVTCDIKVADCEYNTTNLASAMSEVAMHGGRLAVFPELCITGSTCGDLFFQSSLHNAVNNSLAGLVKLSEKIETIFAIGAPIYNNNKLYNCTVFIYKGRIVAVVPKSNLSHGESRYFSVAPQYNSTIEIFESQVPFGNKIILKCESLPSFTMAAELGDDLYSPIPPSVHASLSGANIIINSAAQYELADSDRKHISTIEAHTCKLNCAYVYSNAGYGESTTDFVYSGQRIICEKGNILAHSAPFKNGIIYSEIDTQMLDSEKSKSFRNISDEFNKFDTVSFDMNIADTQLSRKYDANPFVPQADSTQRFEHILQIQAHGLIKRIEHTYCKKLIIGISGGLDSCLALLVSVRALKLMNRPMTDILALTMPCFGTTGRTKSNAQKLCELLGVDFECIDIAKSVTQHFEDIGHAIDNYDVVFENSQARERTQILMDIANKYGGMVIGTGDLSELALGWATYNGDHMSMYGVNADVPKTLIRHIVRYEADTCGSPQIKEVLYDILDTPISPELLPSNNGNIAQKTEDLVGPYELHDFYLYYALRYGFAPDKIYRIACYAFGDTYDVETIKKWLKNFYRRFFNQQFKRSCLPDGPKVGKVGVSPRGDLVMPSDACSTLWMNIAENL